MPSVSVSKMKINLKGFHDAKTFLSIFSVTKSIPPEKDRARPIIFLNLSSNDSCYRKSNDLLSIHPLILLLLVVYSTTTIALRPQLFS